MARVVVVSFTDNDKAQTFIDGIPQVDDIKVEGLFALPTQFCPGSGSGGCRKTGRLGWGWVQGQKFGWWVCAKCKKPSGALSPLGRVRAVVAQGVNLLVPVIPYSEEGHAALDAQADVRDEGWGQLGRGRTFIDGRER